MPTFVRVAASKNIRSFIIKRNGITNEQKHADFSIVFQTSKHLPVLTLILWQGRAGRQRKIQMRVEQRAIFFFTLIHRDYW